MGETRGCGQCGAPVAANVAACPACGASVSDVAPNGRTPVQDRKANPRLLGIAGIFVLAALGVAAWIVFGHPAAPRQAQRTPDVNELKQKAEQGDARAQKELGDLYAKGQGVAQSYTEAAAWYRKAADQGNAAAQTMLGQLSEAGQGMPRDAAAAADWYRRAAEQGDRVGQYSLATLYAVGHGVPLNQAEAIKWYRRAAEQGDALSQYNLGSRYCEGRGVPPDPVEAYKWLSLAAAQGLPDAAQVLDRLKRQMTREQIAEGKRRARGIN
jgi:uncharacterized protein